MSIHPDPVVDRAMRANLGAGFHFFDPDSQRFHESKSVTGFISKRERFAFVVERYRAAFMGGHQVQFPHSRAEIVACPPALNWGHYLHLPTMTMTDASAVEGI